MTEKNNFLIAQESKIFTILAFLFAAAAFIITIIARIRLLNMPLNRDEAVWAYAGALYMKGIVPYTQVFDTKLPGVSYIYGIFMSLFGENTAAVRMSLVFISAAAAFFTYALSRLLFTASAAALAAGVFLIISLSSVVEGLSAYTEHYAAAFALAAVFTALKTGRGKNLWLAFLSGVLASAAVFCKQQAALMMLPAFFYCLPRGGFKTRLKPAMAFSAGFFILFAVIFIQLGFSGALKKACYILFNYSSEYASLVSLHGALNLLADFFKRFSAGAWVFAVVIAAALAAAARNVKRESFAPLILVFFILSLSSACLGLQFRPHYFLLVAPACAIAVAYLFESAGRIKAGKIVILSSIIAAALAVVTNERGFVFSYTGEKASSVLFRGNPFIQAEKAGEYIREKTKPGDSIAVLGSEPEIYFYSKRKAATEYLSFYDLMWAGKGAAAMQAEVIKQVEGSFPKYVVFSNLPVSWLIRENSDMSIFRWYEKYRAKKLVLEGVVDMLSADETKYVFGEEAKKYKAGNYRIDIFKVKD